MNGCGWFPVTRTTASSGIGPSWLVAPKGVHAHKMEIVCDCMNVWMYDWLNVWLCECMIGWIYGHYGPNMDEWITFVLMYVISKGEFMDTWIYGCLD